MDREYDILDHKRRKVNITSPSIFKALTASHLGYPLRHVFFGHHTGMLKVVIYYCQKGQMCQHTLMSFIQV